MSKQELLEEVAVLEGSGLYNDLLHQINKDLNLSGLDFVVKCNPDQLSIDIFKIVYELINNRFDDYLNLLYRVDISENDIKRITSSTIDKIAEEVTVLLLKRECQKVFFRNRI